MAAQDLANGGNAINAPAGKFAAVTPHASNDLGFVSRAIYVGGAGDIAAVDVSGNVVVFKAVPAGTLLPIRVARINAVNTTATNLVALW
ncbi:hypothetical protein [Neorhizobium sp. NCHU2750]|uniref:spike base protein, RCAP_Rcc01079 family n=1 Tax=Neorhizobium sp. NCHU2750 TaxID=1825976 RepID=UPI000E74FC93|nr:hypothetical protein NCHU2750_28220 [Neorhizobium sp. NCHU2750]